MHLSANCSGKIAHHTLPPDSNAPIAEPIIPGTNVALDLTDFPLQDHDDKVFSGQF